MKLLCGLISSILVPALFILYFISLKPNLFFQDQGKLTSNCEKWYQEISCTLLPTFSSGIIWQNSTRYHNQTLTLTQLRILWQQRFLMLPFYSYLHLSLCFHMPPLSYPQFMTSSNQWSGLPIILSPQECYKNGIMQYVVFGISFFLNQCNFLEFYTYCCIYL